MIGLGKAPQAPQIIELSVKTRRDRPATTFLHRRHIPRSKAEGRLSASY